MPIPRWFWAALLAATAYGQQVADPNFNTRVADPAFTSTHPRIGIDESHKNFHTKDGRYKPFAALMAADGFTVAAAPKFTAGALKAIDILVIANALGNEDWNKPEPAFSVAECDAVRDWVRAGGALLLGLVSTFAAVYLPETYTYYSIIFTFVLVAVVLAVRPLGLFGRPA